MVVSIFTIKRERAQFFNFIKENHTIVMFSKTTDVRQVTTLSFLNVRLTICDLPKCIFSIISTYFRKENSMLTILFVQHEKTLTFKTPK